MKILDLGETVGGGRWRVLGALLAALALGACKDDADTAEQEFMGASAEELALPEPLTSSSPSDGEVRSRPKGARGTPVAYLRVETDAPRRLRFRCDSVTLVGCSLGLFDAEGTRLSSARTEAYVKRVDFYVRLPGPGTYYLGVSSSEEGGVGTFRYQLTNLGIDTAGDAEEEAAPIEPGQALEDGLQGAGDVDAYAFAVHAGFTYRVSCSSLEQGRAWSLRFFVPGMSEPEVHAGNYLVEVSSSAFRVQQEGMGIASIETPLGTAPSDTPLAYSCTVEEIADDAPDELVGPARPLAVDTQVTGEFEWTGDVDVFAVTLPARHHLRVDFGCSSQVSYCPVKVYDPTGVGVQSEVGPATSVLWTSAVAGEYRVRVSYAKGPYTLRLSDLGLDDVGDTIPEATVVPSGTPVTGTLPVNWDMDVFAIHAPAGRIVDLTCIAPEATPSDVLLRVTDAAWRDFAYLWLSPTAGQLSVTVPAGEWFWVVAMGAQTPSTYRCDWSVRP
ncbi:hypothetical protein [Hyalangium versicolor]|uniref:hypothetical protein n=1 Tax=Hyalangium versicolor TaxID=2861190 RepID=UPI001CCFBA63|nr:hypothetical protein [Hyalangium versicolor]